MNIRSAIFLYFAIVIPCTIAYGYVPTQPITPTIVPTAFKDTLPPPIGTPQGLDAILVPDVQAAPTINTQNTQQALVQTPTTTNLKEDTKPEEIKDIYLNFDNTELSNFINYIAEIKKLNLIPDKTIEGNKISLTIREPLSIQGAWNVFLTIIEMAGFSIVQVGDVYKIVTKDKKTQQPLMAYIDTPIDNVPDDDSNIRYVMFLTNLQAGDMKDLVTSMLSSNGSAFDVKDVNGLIITDKCYNIKAAVRVLRELDSMGQTETVSVIQLQTANATDVKTLLDSIIKQPDISPLARLLGKTSEGGTQFFPQGTRIIAEPRTNKLILLGNLKPIKKIEEFVKNHIDTELKDAKSPLHIYELQNTDAAQIAAILTEVCAAGESDAGQAAAKNGTIKGGIKSFKKMIFKVDKDGNRLIVSCSDKVDWELLKQTIKNLDKPQPQVGIETLIALITVDDIKQIGGNMRLKKPNSLGQNIGFQSAASNPGSSLSTNPANPASGATTTPVNLLGNMINQLTYQQGLTALTFGNPNGNGIWSVLSMLKSIQNSTILSQPFVTAVNKTTATIEIGQSVRVQQASSGSGANQIVGYDTLTGATKLDLTPQINLDGVIRMNIVAAINEITSTTPSNPETTERKLETNVTVADGQVLALGGFVKTQVTETMYKTPILGDLPLLGWFFKNQNRNIAKTYLFIFLCPTIIKPRTKPGIGLYTTMKLHDATDYIEDAIQTKKMPDPVHNWFFNAEKENYSHKVIDFANARYQPTTVDIKNDPDYRSQTYDEQKPEQQINSIHGDNKVVAQLEQPLLKPLPIETPITVPIQIDTQRNKLKDLISSEEVNTDINKRNTLKEFISGNPALSNRKIVI